MITSRKRGGMACASAISEVFSGSSPCCLASSKMARRAYCFFWVTSIFDAVPEPSAVFFRNVCDACKHSRNPFLMIATQLNLRQTDTRFAEKWQD
jgi:hypothetical protein